MPVPVGAHGNSQMWLDPFDTATQASHRLAARKWAIGKWGQGPAFLRYLASDLQWVNAALLSVTICYLAGSSPKCILHPKCMLQVICNKGLVNTNYELELRLPYNRRSTICERDTQTCLFALRPWTMTLICDLQHDLHNLKM